MKILRFRLIQSKALRGQLSTSFTQAALPDLPLELWRKIISFTIRLTGAKYVDLEDPFSSPSVREEYPEVDPGLFNDRKSLSQVCGLWRSIVIELMAEHIVLYSENELFETVKLFEHSRANSVGKNIKHLGEWTTRIDFKIMGPYKVSHVIRLLQCTPNLMIYCNKNGTTDFTMRPMPVEVLRALVDFSKDTLRRVEWSGDGEAPNYVDLVQFVNSLPNLETLRLLAIHSFPYLSDATPPTITLSNLRNLSLGVIPEISKPRPDYALTWDPLIRYMSINSRQLPLLQRLDCDIFPVHSVSFFRVHGSKLLHFRTTAWSAEDFLPEALDFCPNLHILVVVQGAEKMAIPNFHPSLQKICIVPTIDVFVDVPEHVFKYAVVVPLDNLLKSLEKMVAPRLKELRIQNLGSYHNIVENSTWLRFWWIRWNLQHVLFCDKYGESFQHLQLNRDIFLRA